MDRTVDDEHRSGLRGEIRSWSPGEETPRLKDACLSVTDVENAIRLLVEIRYLAGRAGQRRCVGGRQLAAIFDIEADRPKIVPVHAAVHGKPQRLALGFEILCERCKGPIGPAIVPAPIGADDLPGEVEAANDVRLSVEGLSAARLGPRGPRHREQANHAKQDGSEISPAFAHLKQARCKHASGCSAAGRTCRSASLPSASLPALSGPSPPAIRTDCGRPCARSSR